MGGGGAMRAATKVATFGVNAGLRGASALPFQEQSVTTHARRASGPVGAILSSSPTIEDARNSVSVSSKNGVQKPFLEMDDWEFAGGEEECLLDWMNPMPRVVFGGVPTLEEAKEATSDLKEAVQKEYFSSAIQEFDLSRSGHSERKDCITSEKAVVQSSVPKPIFQAFSLLAESPEAQGVVASLASDKNVWDAVMKNEKVMDFIKWQQTSTISEDIDDANIEKPFPDSLNSSESGRNELTKLIEKLKITVTDMVSNLSGFFQNMFGGETSSISIDENGNAAAAVKTGIGASFMALAVLAIMVAVLKRA